MRADRVVGHTGVEGKDMGRMPMLLFRELAGLPKRRRNRSSFLCHRFISEWGGDFFSTQIVGAALCLYGLGRMGCGGIRFLYRQPVPRNCVYGNCSTLRSRPSGKLSSSSVSMLSVSETVSKNRCRDAGSQSLAHSRARRAVAPDRADGPHPME